MIRKAVIVAAGLATRLHPLTLNCPKSLLSINGESLLARSVRILRDNGIADVGVVVGYRAEMIADAFGSAIVCIPNPFYRHCNNMGSLWMARDFVADAPFAYLHGDLVYSERMLADFLQQAAASRASVDLLTAFGPVDEEAMKVRAHDNGQLIESGKYVAADEAQGEWTGVAVIHRPRSLFETLQRHLLNESLIDYDTAAFTTMASAGEEMRCVPCGVEPWKEIDTLEDLESARADFAPA
ncbi:MAG TPA: sugar phosphate nucleotidyltransferase [Rhodothermia bacterium]|nr:sugar phosphate nucleotidyltransferase [Rhodothermia bacterium]